MSLPEDVPTQRVSVKKPTLSNRGLHAFHLDNIAAVMADRSPRTQIIKDNPIGNGLNTFRASFRSVCETQKISYTPDSLDQLGQESKRQTKE